MRTTRFLLALALIPLPASADPGAFVWPVSAWVTSTSTYRWGERHLGSADLAAPHWTPIGAARDGVVTFVGASRSGAYGVVIDHGDGWRTHYYHLIERAVVRVGERVRANQHVGWVGRTGLASNPHCHFTLVRNGEFQKIPSIRYGVWIARGEPIPGDWDGLPPADPIAAESFAVIVQEDGIDLRAESDASSPRLGRVPPGALLAVFGSGNGFHRVRFDGFDGWVPASGVLPAASGVFGAETAAAAVLRDAPYPSAKPVGSLRAGAAFTVYETREGYHRILQGYPARYAWIAAADARPTGRFRVMVSADSVETRDVPDAAAPVREVILIGENNTILEVQEARNGWYRILHQGVPAWIPGWRTAGRI